jgi:hypothetical protein
LGKKNLKSSFSSVNEEIGEVEKQIQKLGKARTNRSDNADLLA